MIPYPACNSSSSSGDRAVFLRAVPSTPASHPLITFVVGHVWPLNGFLLCLPPRSHPLLGRGAAPATDFAEAVQVHSLPRSQCLIHHQRAGVCSEAGGARRHLRLVRSVAQDSILARPPSTLKPDFKVHLNHSYSSRIRINLIPYGLNLLPLLLRKLSVLRRPLKSLSTQTLVDIALDVAAHAHSLPHEASRVAFVEGAHDFFAACCQVRQEERNRVGMGEEVPVLSLVWRWGCMAGEVV